MALIGGWLAALILKHYKWENIEAPPGYDGERKLETLFGPSFWSEIQGKVVLDYGCGEGQEAIAMARRGAAHVIGREPWEERLKSARLRQTAAAVTNCSFVLAYKSKVDVILSVDSFEHYDHPDHVLREMAQLLRADGSVIACFGLPWYHPKGGHFPLFPWAHLLFTEDSLMTWRSHYKTDGAGRFCEVEGGLNQMSIRKFERLVGNSPLKFQSFETIPIRITRALHCRITREFLTSIVRCRLIHRGTD